MIKNLVEVKISIPSTIKEVESAIQLMILMRKAKEFMVNTKTKEIREHGIPNETWRAMKLVEYATMMKSYSTLKSDAEYEEERGYKWGNNSFNEYVMAGGFASDTYMKEYFNYEFDGSEENYPFKDCDIFVEDVFVDEEVLKELLPEIEEFEVDFFGNGRYSEAFDTMGVIRFSYKGIKFEVVAIKSMARVETFDYRFRNFFYMKNKTFATKEAINDIKEKKLVIQSAHTPTTSLVRGIYFEKKYGFELLEKSKQWLKWELAEYEIDVEKIYQAIDKRAENGIENSWYREKVDVVLGEKRVKTSNLFSEEYYTIPRENINFPFPEGVEELYKNYQLGYIDEETYEQMNSYVPFQHLDKKLRFKENDYSKLHQMISEYNIELSEWLYSDSLRRIIYEDEQLDCDVMRTFADRDVETKIEILKNPKSKEAQEFYVWLQENSFHQPEETIKNLMVSGLLRTLEEIDTELRFSLNTQSFKCALNGDLVIVEIGSGYKNSMVKYRFRKTNRGCFVLAHTDSDLSEYFERESIREVITFLKKEFGELFDFGIKGDMIRTPSFYSEHDYYFNETKDGYVFKTILEDEKETENDELIF